MRDLNSAYILLDIGNTRIKFTVVSQSPNVESREQVQCHSSAQFEVSIESLIAQNIQISHAWISVVASDSVLQEVLILLRKYGIEDVYRAQVQGKSCGVINGYGDFSVLGIDRWLALIGARALVDRGPLIVIDAGTAMTVDYLSVDSVFEGGMIVAGLQMQHDALVNKTARIQSTLLPSPSLLGKTTSDCVNSGARIALVGAASEAVKRIKTEKGDERLSVVITGGDGELIYNEFVAQEKGSDVSIQASRYDVEHMVFGSTEGEKYILCPSLVLLGLASFADEVDTKSAEKMRLS